MMEPEKLRKLLSSGWSGYGDDYMSEEVAAAIDLAVRAVSRVAQLELLCGKVIDRYNQHRHGIFALPILVQEDLARAAKGMPLVGEEVVRDETHRMKDWTGYRPSAPGADGHTEGNP